MNLDLLILRRVNASDHWNYLFGHAANSGWIRWVAKPGATSAFHMQDNTGNKKKIDSISEIHLKVYIALGSVQ